MTSKEIKLKVLVDLEAKMTNVKSVSIEKTKQIGKVKTKKKTIYKFKD